MKVRTLYLNETELIAEAKKANRKAQKALYDRHASKMLSVCRYYINDLQYAEEVLMNGFLKAFTHLGQFSKTDHFGAWLRKIMVREALSFLRKKQPLFFTDLNDAHFVAAPLPSASQLSVHDLQFLIDQLPENQKVVFVLYALEGYTHKEIAATLNIPVGTSKSYLSRSRSVLQQQIKTYSLKKNESKKS